MDVRIRIHAKLAGAMLASTLFAAAAGAQRNVAADTPNRAVDTAEAEQLLARRMTVYLGGLSVRDAITAVSATTKIRFIYRRELVDTIRKIVRLRADRLPLGQIMERILDGTDLQVKALPEAQLGIVMRTDRRGQTSMDGHVTGRVTDAEGKPIVGARITVAGTSVVVETKERGLFTIPNLPPGTYTVRATRLGYTPRDAKITVADGETKTVDFTLTATRTQLTDVVTTATGKQQRVEIGNDIGTIKADSLVRNAPITSLSELLTNRVPGVQAIQTSGAVGAPTKFRIRGLGSLQLNNDPVIVVDGVRLQTQTTANPIVQATSTLVTGVVSSQSTFGTAVNKAGEYAPSRLDDIDPNMIESIDILKGPSATSLYGQDAANGVIVITTKHGRPGPFRLNLSDDNGWGTVSSKLPDYWFGWGQNADGSATNRCRLTDMAAGTCSIDSVTHFNPANNAIMTPLGTAHTSNYSADLSGGSSQVQQRVSVRLNNAVGVSKLPDYEKRRLARTWSSPVPSWMNRPNTDQTYNASSTTSADVWRQLHVDANVNASYRNTINDGSGLQNINNYSSATGLGDTLTILPAESMRQKATTTTKRGYGSLNSNYLATSWLALRAVGGGDYAITANDALARSVDCSADLNPAGCTSTHSNQRDEVFTKSFDAGATVTLPLRSWLNSRTALGEQFNKSTYYSMNAGNAAGTQLGFGTGLLNGVIASPGSGATNLYDVAEANDASSTAGWYLEQQLAVNDRLFLTAGFRQDASSSFGRDARMPILPKYNVSWLVSDEPFFPTLPFVNNLRLRAAFGHAEKQGSQRDLLPNYQQTGLTVNGVAVTGIVLSQVANPLLRPERSEEFEGGMDIGLFRDRVTFDLTFYNKKNRDAIVTTQLPPSTGTATPNLIVTLANLSQNVGTVNNRGTELTFHAILIDRPGFTWDANIGASYNSNKLTHIDPSVTTSTQGSTRLVEGYPVFGYWARPIAGYHDNGDNILTRAEITYADSSVFVGATTPKSQLSYTSTISYHVLSLSAHLSQTNGLVTPIPIGVQASAGGRALFDATAPLGAQAAALQAMDINFGQYFATASLLSLDELSARVELPQRFARQLRASSASLSLMGRNLWRHSNYRGADPMTNTGGATEGLLSDVPEDNGSGIPPLRQWTVRVNLGF